MPQTKRVSRTLELPIDQVREIVSSEVFLLTTEKMVDIGSTEIDNGSREVEADGTVRAFAEVVRPPNEEEGMPEMRARQDSVITPVGEESGQRTFELRSELPLPGNIGTVDSRYHFAEEQGASSEIPGPFTRVEAVVEVSCKLPIVGKKLEANVIENAEQTVDNSLERIRRFS